MECYLKKNIPQNEVAKRNRVTPQLVRDLVRESRKKPEKLLEKKVQEDLD